MTNPLMATYNRLPVTFSQGQGVWLTDTAGQRYLDAVAGVAVCSLGHAHPAVTQAVCEQAGKLVHTSNLYRIAHQQQLGGQLVKLAGMDRVFFANSGAEANEAAIKLARLHGRKKEVAKPTIVVMDNSFHGRTMATLTATGSRRVQAGFEPLVPGFVRVPFGDMQALETAAANNPNIVAVLVEPIQGEGGVRIPPPDYLQNIRALCDAQGWLMMLDEIQTGMGRTGRLFAFQHSGITPDVMTLAKALGNGVPIGACLAAGEAAELFGPGNHGSTFGGNPLASAAALSVVETMTATRLWEQAARLGEHLLAGLGSSLGQQAGVVEIRGVGAMIGIELDRACSELVGRALDKGLLINVTADSVIRLLPPLVMNTEEADQLIRELSQLVVEFLSENQ